MNLINELLQHRSAGLAKETLKGKNDKTCCVIVPVQTFPICVNGASTMLLLYFLWWKRKKKKEKRRKMCKTSTRVLNINFSESQTGVEAGKAPTQHWVDNEEVGSDRRTH